MDSQHWGSNSHSKRMAVSFFSVRSLAFKSMHTSEYLFLFGFKLRPNRLNKLHKIITLNEI